MGGNGTVCSVMMSFYAGCTLAVQAKLFTYLLRGCYTRNGTERNGGKSMVDIVLPKIITQITYLYYVEFSYDRNFMCLFENYGQSGLCEKFYA